MHINNIETKLIIGIIIMITILSGCTYNIIYINDNIPKKINHPIINLYSDDSYNFITIFTKEKLKINNISYIDCNKNYDQCRYPSHISLHIIKTLEKRIIKSLFSDGESAEHQLILTTTINIKTQTNKSYPFSITISKSFFNNPVTILANSVKENIIRKKIYEEISEELINKLLYFMNNHD